MVGQKELTQALSRSGFYLYPCEIAEISSISLMRAQAMGSIPVTSRYKDSALNETAGLWDLGPPAREGLIGKDPEWLAQWIDYVVFAATATNLHEHRRKMKEWARAKFSWARAGRQWDYIFQNGVHGQGLVDIDVLSPLDASLHYNFAYPEARAPTPHAEL
jgi:glycosyltransferase involved in cell wall biosynthesis